MKSSIDTILQCERAIEDIRRGMLVRLQTDTSELYVAAAEEVSEHILQVMQQPRLLLAGPRLAYLTEGKQDQPGTIAIQNKEDSMHYAGVVSPLDKREVTEYQPATESELLALELMKLTHILPALLVSNKVDMEDSSALTYCNAETIQAYKESLNSELTPVIEAPLTLEGAEHARIVAFRPALGGHEHYAIIIGNPDISDAPLVRVHSSCYTGDLLGSLGCDCGGQLQSAIAQMGASDEGGVIIYLLQEGRGIGLTNKLRTYALQAEGIDTVDANHYLGFDDDARLFSLAAAMLTQLNMPKIRLLSNNPRKADGLTPYGIEVAECVPHIMEANEHNKHYLATKFTRLGHNRSK